MDDTLDVKYLQGEGVDEMVSMTIGDQTYFLNQDGRGNTSEMANAKAMAVETYKYGLNGVPTVYDPSETELAGDSMVANRFMFGRRGYYEEFRLCYPRNHFYLPSLGRFLQPDPIGFGGDPANPYRYAGASPASVSEPTQQCQ